MGYVLAYLLSEIKVTGKIGVYGRSLGGIPSCYISPFVDMVIVDRSFSSLRAMALSRYNSRFADLLFKLGSCGWQSQNDFDFLRTYRGLRQFAKHEPAKLAASNFGEAADTEAAKQMCRPSTYKLVTQDKNDEIIDIFSSLMVGVAVESAKLHKSRTQWSGQLGILSHTECSQLIRSLLALQNLEQDLHVYLRKCFWRNLKQTEVSPPVGTS